jgi:hypothetical protein
MSQPGVSDTIPYSRRDQFVDRWRGRRDGRRRIPSYSDLYERVTAGARISTPYLEALSRRGLHEMDREYVAFERRTVGSHNRLTALRKELAVATDRVDRAGRAVTEAEAPLTESELLPRNPTELNRGRAAVLGRRSAMRDRRIEGARDELAARQSTMDSMASQIATAQEEILREFVIAQAKARQVGEHYALRAATYWEGITLTHPEGRQLAPMLPYLRPVLPAWATASPDRDPEELGRWRFELRQQDRSDDPASELEDEQ